MFKSNKKGILKMAGPFNIGSASVPILVNLNPSDFKKAKNIEPVSMYGFYVNNKTREMVNDPNLINAYHAGKKLGSCWEKRPTERVIGSFSEYRKNNFLFPIQTLLKCNNRLAKEKKPHLPSDILKRVARMFEKIY